MGSALDEHCTKLRRGSSGSKLSLIFLIGFIVPIQGFSLKDCRISNTTAICSNKKLQSVPQDLPSTVAIIDLSKNRISEIQAGDFKNHHILARLDLNGNHIAQIKSGAFVSLISLNKLNLNSNMLVKLDEDIFVGLSSLVELRISHNRIKEVAFNAFKSLSGLKFLDVSYNKLHNITKVHLILQHLPNLQKLVIQKNDLTTFQSSELRNSSLELRYLDLSENPLAVFRITADVFPNLFWLSIGGTQGKHQMILDVHNKTFLSHVSTLDISGISMALSNVKRLLEMMNTSLTSLRMNKMKKHLTELINISCTIPTLSKLQIQHHKLQVISSYLFKQCVNIKELDLSNNKIKNISDDAFRSLQGLTILDLSHNNLSSVPAATRNLANLTELDLSSNQISKLRCEDFTNHTKLRHLSLYQNSIPALEECLFKDLQKLQVLKLQTSHIINLNGAFEKYLPNLRKLHLNGNEIISIKGGEFKGLRSLENLSLHENLIKNLDKESFIGLTNLTVLQLQRNKITEKDIKRGAFNTLINLRRLDLSDNYIKYDNRSRFPPPFSELSHLEELSCQAQGHRGWNFLPVNFLQGLSNLLLFKARNLRLQSLHKYTFNSTPRLETLDISSNNLYNLSPYLFSPLRNLKSLYITRISLQSLDFFIDANLTKLEFLQARTNQFSVISTDVINSLPALVYADLEGNSFLCDCDNKEFVQWAENNSQTQVPDAFNLECNYPPSFKGKKLLDFDVQSCSVDTNFILFITTTCTILCFMVVPFTYHFMRWQLVYAYYIFLAWLADTKHKNRQAPHQYDAFISYNTHDEPWVIRELLPKLEGEQGWRLCLHHRDFEPGKPIIDNITDAIYGSRKTICVISHRYLESEWCSREIQAASFRLFDEKKDVLILVFLEEIPSAQLSPYHRMRKLLKRQTYLSWPRAGEHVALFWEKLRQALQTREELDENRFLLTVMDGP